MNLKLSYIADALAEFHTAYPGVRMDHDGYFEISAAVINANKQFDTGKPYKVPFSLWETAE
jgi:hypothetical protein